MACKPTISDEVWDNLDWQRSAPEIARKLNTKPEIVRRAAAKRQIVLPAAVKGNPPRINWAALDYNRYTIPDLVKRYSVSRQFAWRMRNKYLDKSNGTARATENQAAS